MPRNGLYHEIHKIAFKTKKKFIHENMLVSREIYSKHIHKFVNLYKLRLQF